MQTSYPIIGDLVLIGGGHAQISVLKAFAMKPLPGLRLTLVTNSSHTPYSGILPGYVEGVYQDEDLHIDLRHLAAAANARMIVATVTGMDADLKKIYFDDRPALRFDMLSINIGGQPSLAAIDGAAKHAIPVKPIAKFQAIAFKLADMATAIEAADLLTLQACGLKIAGKPVTKESAMAKYEASEVCVRVATEAVQILGGYGYTKDFPAEKFYRDSKLCTIGEGTSEIQKLVISRELLKD